MSALFLPPRNAESFVLCSSSRDIRPGSDRHLDQLDRQGKAPKNRIEHLLPLAKAVGSHIAPVITVARVPGTKPLNAIVKRIVEKRSAAATV